MFKRIKIFFQVWQLYPEYTQLEQEIDILNGEKERYEKKISSLKAEVCELEEKLEKIQKKIEEEDFIYLRELLELHPDYEIASLDFNESNPCFEEKKFRDQYDDYIKTMKYYAYSYIEKLAFAWGVPPKKLRKIFEQYNKTWLECIDTTNAYNATQKRFLFLMTGFHIPVKLKEELEPR